MIITADKNITDGVYHRFLSMGDFDLPILLLSRREELDFNDEVLSLQGKEYVVMDVIENGWNYAFDETLVVGDNTEKFDFLKGEGWKTLHDFIKANPPKLYFKRELLKKDVTDFLLPIEYPNWQPDYQLQTREEFNNRRISIFHYWGRSHEARLMVHGSMWKKAAQNGYAVCDNIYFLNNFIKEETNPTLLVSLWMPHYARVDISEIMNINANSKLSISLPGCGIKCFRSTGESIVNSVVVLPDDNLAYSYELIDEVNCIRFPIADCEGVEKEWPVMLKCEHALKYDNLYDIYVEGKKAADWYRVVNYLNNYLQPLINKK